GDTIWTNDAGIYKLIDFPTGVSFEPALGATKFRIGLGNLIDPGGQEEFLFGIDNVVTNGIEGTYAFGEGNNLAANSSVAVGMFNVVSDTADNFHFLFGSENQAEDNGHAYLLGESNTNRANNGFTLGFRNVLDHNTSGLVGMDNVTSG